MPLLLKFKSSAMRRTTKMIGRFAFVLALTFMSLEMMRVQGWGVGLIESLASALSLSVNEFWTVVASFSVIAAFGLLVVGLSASAVSRSSLLDRTDPKEEQIDVQALSELLRSYELYEAERSTAPTPLT